MAIYKSNVDIMVILNIDIAKWYKKYNVQRRLCLDSSSRIAVTVAIAAVGTATTEGGCTLTAVAKWQRR